ncbi:MAG: ABC transporter substrate-binding protein [Azospirillaceae bacterium]
MNTPFGTGPLGTGPGALLLGRRRFLEVTATGAVAVAAAGTVAGRRAWGQSETVRWVSPRGTIEVLDDYPYWVAVQYGYFGDIETVLEPGPMDATATIKLVDQDQADFGYPSPGVFSLGLEQGIPLRSVWHMGAYDVFSFAFRKGERVADAGELAGKTILLGSIGWKAIVDPMLAQVGVDPASVNYAEAGAGWAQALSQGQGDAALSWEGLRAQWYGQGLDFDYILPYEFSQFPANSFVMRESDYQDGGRQDLYERYLRGWAMGLEFGHRNPRAATHIVLERFPALASSLTPEVATESMMQLAKVFRGDWETRQGWGWHDFDQWQLYFDTIAEIGQVSRQIDPANVLSNDYVAAANDFDVAAIQADADGYELPEEFQTVDVEAVRARL